MEKSVIILEDDLGNKIECEVLLTYKDDKE